MARQRRRVTEDQVQARYTQLFHVLERQLRRGGARWFAKDNRVGLLLHAGAAPPDTGHTWYQKLEDAVDEMRREETVGGRPRKTTRQ